MQHWALECLTPTYCLETSAQTETHLLRHSPLLNTTGSREYTTGGPHRLHSLALWNGDSEIRTSIALGTVKSKSARGSVLQARVAAGCPVIPAGGDCLCPSTKFNRAQLHPISCQFPRIRRMTITCSKSRVQVFQLMRTGLCAKYLLISRLSGSRGVSIPRRRPYMSEPRPPSVLCALCMGNLLTQISGIDPLRNSVD